MIYDKVKRLCEETKTPVTRMEKDLGLSRGSVIKWNTVDPGVSKVKKVADYFGKPIEYFLE